MNTTITWIIITIGIAFALPIIIIIWAIAIYIIKDLINTENRKKE